MLPELVLFQPLKCLETKLTGASHSNLNLWLDGALFYYP
jgi:hypothetical protein